MSTEHAAVYRCIDTPNGGWVEVKITAGSHKVLLGVTVTSDDIDYGPFVVDPSKGTTHNAPASGGYAVCCEITKCFGEHPAHEINMRAYPDAMTPAEIGKILYKSMGAVVGRKVVFSGIPNGEEFGVNATKANKQAHAGYISDDELAGRFTVEGGLSWAGENIAPTVVAPRSSTNMTRSRGGCQDRSPVATGPVSRGQRGGGNTYAAQFHMEGKSGIRYESIPLVFLTHMPKVEYRVRVCDKKVREERPTSFVEHVGGTAAAIQEDPESSDDDDVESVPGESGVESVKPSDAMSLDGVD